MEAISFKEVVKSYERTARNLGVNRKNSQKHKVDGVLEALRVAKENKTKVYL